MRKNIPAIINTILILSMAILACGGVTITLNGSNTPSSAPQIIPSEGPSSSQIANSTEIPAPSTGTNYDLYAGFNKNKPISFVILHKSGEKLGSVQDIYSNYPRNVVWVSASGETITIYGDRDNGLPKSVVIGNDVLFYTNYTDTTVDLTLVHPNGSRESARVKRNADILNKISAIFITPTALMARTIPASFNSQAEIFNGVAKASLYLAGAAECIGGVAGGVTAGGPVGLAIALVSLGDACRGFILTTVIQAGKFANLNVANLEKINQKLDIGGCIFIDARDCLDVATDQLDQYLQGASKVYVNVPAATYPTPTQSAHYP